MPPDDDPNFDFESAQRRGGLRRAPVSGDVVGRGGTGEHEFDEDPTDDGPTAADIERFSSVTRRCPSCAKDVFDDAEVCYHCGEPMLSVKSTGPPMWVVITAIVVLAAFVLMYTL